LQKEAYGDHFANVAGMEVVLPCIHDKLEKAIAFKDFDRLSFRYGVEI